MIIRFCIFAMTMVFAGVAQPVVASPADGPVRRCGGPYGKCGYVDKVSGRELIPLRYEVAQPFSEGLAAVRIEGRYGYIDRGGKMIIAPRYEAGGTFLSGYAEVRINGASGIIDRSGALVVPARFASIMPFSKGTFVAEPLPPGQKRSSRPDARLGSLSDQLSLLNVGRAGLFHITRGWLTEPKLKFDFFDDPARGLIWAADRGPRGDDEWGLLRTDGRWQVTPRFGHVQALRENRAVVTGLPDPALPPSQGREGVRWGAVDRDGQQVVPLKYQHLSYWRGGYGSASDTKPVDAQGHRNVQKRGLVRPDGELLGDRWFDEIEIGDEQGELPRVRLGMIWHSIEPNGRLIADQRGGSTMVDCPGGLRILARGEMVEFIKRDGTSSGLFDKGYFATRSCPGPFSAKRGGKWFIVLENGLVLGGSRGFDDSYSLTGTHTAVQVDGLWGVIDRSGTFTVTPRFAKLSPDRQNSFMVGEGDDVFWIDVTGKRVERPAILRPVPAQALLCGGGLRLVGRAGLWGLENGSGKPVIAPRYRALSCFQEGVAWSAEPGAKQWCPIGPSGSRVAGLSCRETYYAMRVTHSYPEQLSPDPYESSVLWNRAWLDYLAGKRDRPPDWISERRFNSVRVVGSEPSAKTR